MPIINKDQYNDNQISVVSNCFEQSYTAHPFIIFEDELNQYWYLKCRSATNHKQKETEILLPKNGLKHHSLLWNDTLVDCSHIFIMDKDELESIVDQNHIIYANSQTIDENIMADIFNKLDTKINAVTPYICLTNVKLNPSHEITFTTLYCHEYKLKDEYQSLVYKNNTHINKDHLKWLLNEVINVRNIENENFVKTNVKGTVMEARMNFFDEYLRYHKNFEL